MLLSEQEVRDEFSEHFNGHSKTTPAVVERVLALPSVRSSNLIT